MTRVVLESKFPISLGRNRNLIGTTILDWIKSNEHKYIYINRHKYDIIDANNFYIAYNKYYGCTQYLDIIKLKYYTRKVDGIEIIMIRTV